MRSSTPALRSSSAIIPIRETDWDAFNKIVDDLMAGYDYPTDKSSGKTAAA